MKDRVKVRVEGHPEAIAQVLRTVRDAYEVVNESAPQKLTDGGDRTVVYQYITVKVDPSMDGTNAKRERDDHDPTRRG